MIYISNRPACPKCGTPYIISTSGKTKTYRCQKCQTSQKQ